MKHTASKFSLAICAATVLATASSQAITTLIAQGVTGDPFFTSAGATSFSQWGDVSLNTYPGRGGFPGSGPWTDPLAATGGDTSAVITKGNGPGGGPYPASASIYFGGFSGDLNYNGGTLNITDSSPITSLQTVVFQFQIGEAWGYDLYNGVLPVLSFTAGGDSATNVVADYSSVFQKISNGTVSMPTGEEEVFINTYALQWDLSGITEPITDISISFNGVQHAQAYGFKLEQFDTAQAGSILPPAVPEPSAALLGAVGMLVLFRRKK